MICLKDNQTAFQPLAIMAGGFFFLRKLFECAKA